LLTIVAASLVSLGAPAAENATVDAAAAALEDELIAWRRNLHESPELSNREFETSKKVADHLRKLGMEVRTGIAHTGVVGILNPGKEGPVVALRADMDGLPVTEKTGLPFASTKRATFNGIETGVMHACGHDAHVAILMATAELLAGMRDELPGSVMFVFQPAEEGAPEGEEGGAELMLKQGVFSNPQPDVVFGLHVTSVEKAGVIAYRSGPYMASADEFSIVVSGRQTHGAKPWQGVDPIVVSSQIIMGLQTIASRQIDVTRAPSVISVGQINGGIRFNIIPDSVTMVGTIRTFDEDMRADIHRRIRIMATSIAESAGATAEISFGLGIPVVVNDPQLTERMLPTLRRVAGDAQVRETGLITWAEDFAYYAQQKPALFFHLGVTDPSLDPATAPANHSPFFKIDESGLIVGVRALSQLTIDFMETNQGVQPGD
jgi:amidohydrolase